MPTATPTTPCAKLKCPVPRVVSAMTRGTSTPSVAAEIPSRSCAATITEGSFDAAKTALRTHSGTRPIIRRGRRPQLCAGAGTTTIGGWGHGIDVRPLPSKVATQLLEEIVGSQHHRSFSLDWPFEELTR